MIIGLTGGIGSGKTTVAKLFAGFTTVAIYIADIEAKKLLNSSVHICKKIREAFGSASYKEGQLDTIYLGSVVFQNKEKLEILNNIVHPEVHEHFKKFVALQTGKAYIIYESAILFESNSQDKFDFVIAVSAALEARINRVEKRDKLSRTAILNRIEAQWKEDKKCHLSNYVILNNSLQETKKQVKDIHNILTKKADLIL